MSGGRKSEKEKEKGGRIQEFKGPKVGAKREWPVMFCLKCHCWATLREALE